MSRPHTRKLPARRGSFSWGRAPEPARGIVIWRLFRRDQSGRLHALQLAFSDHDPREYIANELRHARHHLRNKVDEIDLEIMGVTQ
jgi:hypothetical protein